MMTLVQSDPVSTLVLVTADFWKRTREALVLQLALSTRPLICWNGSVSNWIEVGPATNKDSIKIKNLTHHHLNQPVEQPVLPDGDEALHLPEELERSFARDDSLIVKEGRSGSSVNFDIFPTESEFRIGSLF